MPHYYPSPAAPPAVLWRARFGSTARPGTRARCTSSQVADCDPATHSTRHYVVVLLDTYRPSVLNLPEHRTTQASSR